MRTAKLGFLHRGVGDYIICEDGVLLDEWKEPIKSDEAGYVRLCGRGGRITTMKLAVIVARAFCGIGTDIPPGKQLIYLDGNPNNVHADNLYWSGLPRMLKELEKQEKEARRKRKYEKHRKHNAKKV